MKLWHILAITILAAVALYGETRPTQEIPVSAEVVASTTTVVVRGQLYTIIEDDYITTSNGRLVHYQVLELTK